MRRGMECLLAVLRGECGAGAWSDAELEAALALAERERVLPWTARCLRRSDDTLSARVRERLDAVDRQAKLEAFYWASELMGVLRAFEASHVRAAPLKGPFFAERVYGEAALRASRDLDILVSKRELSCAEACLRASGFVPGIPDDYHCQWQRAGTIVELHRDVENPLAFDFATESALRRAQPALFQGQRCWQLTAEDELLFLCLHGVRHRFESLGLVVDIQLAYRQLDAWTGSSPASAEMRKVLALGVAMARRLQPMLPACDVATSREETQRIGALADSVWDRMLMREAEKLDWRGAHAFFVELERPGWPRMVRRWRHLRILALRVMDRDFLFAARFGLRRRWQAWALRPVRLISAMVSNLIAGRRGEGPGAPSRGRPTLCRPTTGRELGGRRR